MKMNMNSKKGDSRKIPAETAGRIGASIKQKVPWTQPLRTTGSPDNTSKSLLKRIVPSKVSIGRIDRLKSPKNSIYGPKRRSPVHQEQTKDQTINKCLKDTSAKNESHQRENGKSNPSHAHKTKHERPSSPIIVDPKLIKNVLESKVNYSTQKSSNAPGDKNKDTDEMPKLMICQQPLDLESLTNSHNAELGATKPMGCMYEITVEERGGIISADGESNSGKTTTTMPGNVILLSSPEDADPASGAVRYIPAAILLMDPREYSEGLTSEDSTSMGLQAAMALQSEQNRVISDMINDNTTSPDTNTPPKRHDNNTEKKENITPLMIRRSEEDAKSTQSKKNGECLASEHRRSNENQTITERNNESTKSIGNMSLERTHNDDLSIQKSQVPTFHNILSEISDSSKSYVGDQSAGSCALYRRHHSLQFKQENYTETKNVDIIQQSVNERNYGEFRFENGETCNSPVHVNGKERTLQNKLKPTSNDLSRDQCFNNLAEETQREKNGFMETRKADEGDLNLEANPSMNPQSEDFESELSTSNVSSARFQQSDFETDDQNSSGAFSVNLAVTKSPFEIHLPVKNSINNPENSQSVPVTCHFERLSRVRSRDKKREQRSGKQHLHSNKHVYTPNMPPYGTKITEISSEAQRMSKPPLHCGYLNNNMKEASRKTDMTIPVYHMAQIMQKDPYPKPVTDSLHFKNGEKIQEAPQRRLNTLDLLTASSGNVIMKSSSEQMEQMDRKQIEREKRLPARPKYEGRRRTENAGKQFLLGNHENDRTIMMQYFSDVRGLITFPRGRPRPNSPPITCPDSRCGLMLSSLTMLPHFNKEHAQVPFVLVHAARNISISINLGDMPPYSPKIFAFFHVIEKMRFEPPIDTVEDLALRDMPWAANHEAWVFSIKEATEPYLQRIVHNFHVLSDDDLAIRATQGDLAVGVERLNGGNFALGSYLGEEAVATLRLMSEDLYWGSVAMIARKGSPFMPSLNNMLGRLVDSGIPLHLEGEVVRQFLSQRLQLGVQISAVTENTGPTLLSMSHVQGAFTLLVLGLVAALATFIGECLYHTLCQTRRSK